MKGQDIGEQQIEVVVGPHGEHHIPKKSLLTKLEETFSGIFVLILSGRRNTLPMGIFLMSISFLQLAAVLADERLNLRLDITAYSYMHSILLAVRISGLAKLFASIKVYYVIAYGGFALLLFYFFLLYKLAQQPPVYLRHGTLTVWLASLITNLLYWVLLVPMTDVLCQMFSCSGTHETLGLTCWGGEHLAHVLSFTICTICFLLAIILCILFSFDSNPYSGEAFSRLQWSFEAFYALLRLVCVIIASFLYSSNYHWLMYLFMVLGSLVLVWYSFVYVPYFNPTMTDLFGGCVLSLSWLLFCALLTEALSGAGIVYQGGAYGALLGFVTIGLFAGNLRHNDTESALRTNNHIKIMDEFRFLNYMDRLIRLHAAMQSNLATPFDELLMYGYIATHRRECDNPACPLNNDEELLLPLTHQISKPRNGIRALDDPVALLFLFSRMYQHNIDIAKTTAHLRTRQVQAATTAHNTVQRGPLTCVTYAYYIMHKVGNIHQAAVLLEVADLLNASLSLRHTTRVAKLFLERVADESRHRDIEMNLQADPKNAASEAVDVQTQERTQAHQEFLATLDPRKVLIYEETFKHFESLLIRSAGCHLDFWRELSQEIPDLQELHDKGQAILDIYESIETGWHQLLVLHRGSPKAHLLYGQYLKCITGTWDEAEVHLKQALQAEELQALRSIDAQFNTRDTMQYMCHPQTVVVVVSAMPEQEGRICKSSANALDVFGYSKQELVGRQLSLLMPDFFAAQHSEFMRRFLVSGKKHIIDRLFPTFAVDRNGYLLPIQVLIKHYYDLVYGSVFTGLISLLAKNEEVLIADSCGRVLGVTRGAGEDFGGLSPLFLSEGQPSIALFCPEMDAESGLFEAQYKGLTGYHTYKCMIPRNATSFASLFHAVRIAQQGAHTPNKQTLDADSPPIKSKELSLGKQKSKLGLPGSSSEQLRHDCEPKTITFHITDFHDAEHRLAIKIFSYQRDKTPMSEAQALHSARKTKIVPEFEPPPRLKPLFLPQEEELVPELAPSPLEDEAAPDSGMADISHQPSDASRDQSSMERLVPGLSRISLAGNVPGAADESSREDKAIPIQPLAQSQSQSKSKSKSKSKFQFQQEEARRQKQSDANGNGRAKGKRSKKDEMARHSVDDVAEERAIRDINELRKCSLQKYHPELVQYLKLALSLSAIIIFLIATISFALNVDVSSNMMRYSRYVNMTRILSVLDIAEGTRSLVLLSPSNSYGRQMIDDQGHTAGYNYSSLLDPTSPPLAYWQWKKAVLRSSADFLLGIQSAAQWLELELADEDKARDLNPVDLKYEFPKMQNQSTEESGFALSIISYYADQAYRLYNYNLTNFHDNDESTAFIIRNGYYSIEGRLQELALTIQNSIATTKATIQLLSLTSLLLVSAFTLVTLLVLTIILYRMRHYKSINLQLLFDVKRHSVKQQLRLCAKFNTDEGFAKRDAHWAIFPTVDREHSQPPSPEPSQHRDRSIDHDHDQEQQSKSNKNREKDKERDSTQDLEESRALLPGQPKQDGQRTTRPHKPYMGHVKLNVLKVLIFTLGEVAYFLQNYLYLASVFKSLSIHLDEYIQLKSTIINCNRLYSYTLEFLGTNGTTQRSTESMEQFLQRVSKTLIKSGQFFHKSHHERASYFSPNYNLLSLGESIR